jgi:hypothetical protein
MTRLLNAAMLALTMGSAAAAQTGQPMKYPNSYAAWKSHLDCIGEDYFECDDTSKTCLRGKTNVGGGFVFVGEQLAEDRSTVIAHVMGQGSYWLNFDSGETDPPQVGLLPFGIHADDQPPQFGDNPDNCQLVEQYLHRHDPAH